VLKVKDSRRCFSWEAVDTWASGGAGPPHIWYIFGLGINPLLYRPPLYQGGTKAEL
jgi:hypothetical protein